MHDVQYCLIFSNLFTVTGVTKVATDLEAKTVLVDHDESVTPEFLLEKLLKVRLSLPSAEEDSLILSC